MTQKTASPSDLRSVAQALERIRGEASEENWNGGGEAPVSEGTFLQAKRFLSLLSAIPNPPEISADADGEVEFEWYVGPRRVFSVSIGEGGRLTFAGLFGESVHHGVEYLREEIPLTILQLIRRTHE